MKDTFAVRLMKAQNRAGLTNREVYRGARISKTALTKYQSELRKNPSMDSLLGLCRVLGCSPDYLCGFSEDFGTWQEPVSDFPSRLKNAWKRIQMTPTELAEATRCSLYLIQFWCDGVVKNPHITSIKRLCAALECSAEYLLGMSNDPQVR